MKTHIKVKNDEFCNLLRLKICLLVFSMYFMSFYGLSTNIYQLLKKLLFIVFLNNCFLML